MKVTTERLEQCQINVIIELDAAEVDERMRRTARKISRQFNVPGYRRGKAPYAAVLRVFGEKAVQQEMVEDSGQELYQKALDEIKSQYELYDQGELKNVEWDPFRMTVVVPIQPEVDLGDYRAVREPFETEAVTDGQVEERLRQIQDQHAQWIPVERPAAIGDQVVMDAMGKVGEREVLNLEGHELVLTEESTDPLPGFHEQIVGMSAGESKTFVLTYPEDHPRKEAAGKEAAFSVHLHTVKQQDKPPLDDELAMMVGAYSTLDELRAAIRQQLEAEALEKAKPAYLDKVLGAMVERATRIEYPPQAVDREIDLAVNRMERNLARSGLKLDRYLQMIGKSREAYRAGLRPTAEERLKKRLVMVEVAKAEGIKVSEAEVDAEVERLSLLLGDEMEELRQALATPEGRLSLADDLLTDKVQERIIAIGKGEAPPLPEPEPAQAEAEQEAPPAPASAEEQAKAAVAQASGVASEVPEVPTEVQQAAAVPEVEG